MIAVLDRKSVAACPLLLIEEHIIRVIIVVSVIIIIVVVIVVVATRGAANDRATAVDRFLRCFVAAQFASLEH